MAVHSSKAELGKLGESRSRRDIAFVSTTASLAGRAVLTSLTVALLNTELDFSGCDLSVNV